MAENEFEQVAVHCVEEILSFQHLANAMEETLTEWNSKLHEKIVEYNNHWDEIKDAHDQLVTTLKDEVQEQSEELGKITGEIEAASNSLHQLLAKATEQKFVLEEATRIFGTSLKDYFEKHKDRQAKQADAHHQLISAYEENGAEVEQADETIGSLLSGFAAKVTEHSEHTGERMAHMHEQLDQHAELAGHEYETLAQQLDEVHEGARQKLTEHQEELLGSCIEVAGMLEEGLSQSVGLLAEAAEALGADFSGLREKVEEIASNLQESADDVHGELHATAQGLEKSVETLGGLQKLLEKFS
ncbi:MAG: hypothetical protein ACR2IE_10565 [Candidatus Sumerlaeaceae bacterium]